MPFVLLLPIVGFGWGHWDRALTLRGEAGLPWVLLAGLLLQAGTMWLNAALDRDSGEILMSRAIPVPKSTALWGYLALALAVGCAFVGHFISGCACATCAILAILYSHPATVWKGHPIL